ncbi:MAG: HIT domain-containing protein [Nitrospinae bacterium]|nr:HIT domain-containing protein [Nitrospinota bacterium]
MSGGKTMWAPWRIGYILGEKPDGCVLCDMPKMDEDERNHIIHRGTTCYVIMNLYPYNNGHLMIVPFRHLSDYENLTSAELAESAELTARAVRALKKAMKPDGFNIGVNLGKAGGAGIDEHLHVHIVPRWSGDINFMTAVGGVRVIPQCLEETYHTLKEAFASVE